jgi:hypothetical protein
MGCLKTNIMKLSPWEAASCAATQELANTLWNPEAYNHVHKTPPAVPMLWAISIQPLPPHHVPPKFVLIVTIVFVFLVFPAGFVL